jgi:formate-dependent nitrite reductase membrane component NrfD
MFTNAMVNQFLLGAVVICCLVAAVFFWRFYRRTRDRLLGIFAVAFVILGLNWLALAFTSPTEDRAALYAMRLAAFSLIIVGIIDKNRVRQ